MWAQTLDLFWNFHPAQADTALLACPIKEVNSASWLANGEGLGLGHCNYIAGWEKSSAFLPVTTVEFRYCDNFV